MNSIAVDAAAVTEGLPLAGKKRIIYGVQGTGNGHISRACAMNKALKRQGGFEISWVMSGRPEGPIMCCDSYDWYRGLTFSIKNGRVDMLNTLTGNNFFQLIRDINSLSLSGYDLVVTDYEPILAWAARKQGVRSIGIGHQYAFDYSVPIKGRNSPAKRLMNLFAPVDTKVGLHWHHFDQPILPPIIDMHGVNLDQEVVSNKVLVYLPFENQDELVQICQSLPQWQFYIYSSQMEHFNRGNVHTRPISKKGFKNDLVTSASIICNSGFELISECLPLGKRILTKPLDGQIEQLSNAMALDELGYAKVTKVLNRRVVKNWLRKSDATFKVNYPDVAAALADWLVDPDSESVEALSKRLWEKVSVSKMTD